MHTVLLLTALTAGQTETPDFPPATREAAVAATVRIFNPARNEQGSGVILAENGPFVYILTANHIVDQAERLEIQTFSARSLPRPEAVYRSGVVFAQGKDEDLAVLRLATSDRMPGRVHVCPPARVPKEAGFVALTVGCSNGRAPVCQQEKVTGLKRLRRPGADPVKLWETDREPAYGRSGGPLLDRQGQLLGIASGKSGGKGYFTHPEEIQRFFKRYGLQWLGEPGHAE
jgi:S1-C subfamily serine protease